MECCEFYSKRQSNSKKEGGYNSSSPDLPNRPVICIKSTFLYTRAPKYIPIHKMVIRIRFPAQSASFKLTHITPNPITAQIFLEICATLGTTPSRTHIRNLTFMIFPHQILTGYTNPTSTFLTICKSAIYMSPA